MKLSIYERKPEKGASHRDLGSRSDTPMTLVGNIGRPSSLFRIHKHCKLSPMKNDRRTTALLDNFRINRIYTEEFDRQ